MLEFTAVVVIIFASVVLGAVGALDSQQIGTLLAAIAGYVLGRATTRSTTKGGEDGQHPGVADTATETRTPVSTRELSELLKAVSGTAEVDKPPVVKISKPVPTDEECTVDENKIAVRGRATDDKGVTEVRWTNETTQSSGLAKLSDGTTSRTWRVSEVELVEGENELTVVAADVSGNISEPATILVTFTKAPVAKPEEGSDKGTPQEGA